MAFGLGTIEWTAVEFEDAPAAVEPKAKLSEVLAVICAGEGVTTGEVYSPLRHRRIAKPRQMAYALARDLTGLSYPALGRLFRRDHTSLLYGYRVIARRSASEPEFAEKMLNYRAQVCAMASERIANTPPIEIPPLPAKSPSLRWATRNKLPRITANGEWNEERA